MHGETVKLKFHLGSLGF